MQTNFHPPPSAYTRSRYTIPRGTGRSYYPLKPNNILADSSATLAFLFNSIYAIQRQSSGIVMFYFLPVVKKTEDGKPPTRIVTFIQNRCHLNHLQSDVKYLYCRWNKQGSRFLSYPQHHRLFPANTALVPVVGFLKPMLCHICRSTILADFSTTQDPDSVDECHFRITPIVFSVAGSLLAYTGIGQGRPDCKCRP